MINSLDDAVKAVKELCLNYSDEKLKDVLLFYFKELRKSLCKVHSEPDFECQSCKNEMMRLQAFQGIATMFSEMTKLGSG